jgi:hypothetical protein
MIILYLLLHDPKRTKIAIPPLFRLKVLGHWSDSSLVSTS